MATDPQRTSILGVAIREPTRLQEVSATVALHGFGDILLRSPLRRFVKERGGVRAPSERSERAPAPERFRRLLEALGPTYVMLGQMLSMRPDRVPPEYVTGLRKLRGHATALPFEEIRDVLEQGLDRPVEQVFAQFDEHPLATAHVAQIHRATTREGQRVIVKVQRPGIERTTRGDLDLLHLGARILEAAIDEANLSGPSDLVTEFEKALGQELDFTFELGNIMTARRFLAHQRKVTAPAPLPQLSCRSVLTMEIFDGEPLRELEPRSKRAQRVVEELLHIAFRQVFVDGFFHGDPHTGNILINEDDEICLIDWGLVGWLSSDQRDDLLTLARAIISSDVHTIARVLLRMGEPTSRLKVADLEADIARFPSSHLQVASLGGATRFTQDFVRAARKYQVKLATEYSVMAKAVGTVEGIVRHLHPDVPIVDIAREHLEPLVQSAG